MAFSMKMAEDREGIAHTIGWPNGAWPTPLVAVVAEMVGNRDELINSILR
jgi:hypothetical protein